MEKTTKIVVIIIIAVLIFVSIPIIIRVLTFYNAEKTQIEIAKGAQNTTTLIDDYKSFHLRVEGYNTTCASDPNSVYVRLYGRNGGVKAAHNIKLYVDDEPVSTISNTTLEAGVTTSWLVEKGGICSKWINKTRAVKISSDETNAEKSFMFKCTNGVC